MENFISIENIKFRKKQISKDNFIDLFIYSVIQRRKFIDGSYLCSLDYICKILYSDTKKKYLNKIRESLHRLFADGYIKIDLFNLQSIVFIDDTNLNRQFDAFSKIYYEEIDQIINLHNVDVDKSKLFYLFAFVVSNIFNNKHYCDLSYQYLKDKTGFSEHTIQKYLDVLCDLKILYMPKSIRFYNVNTKVCNNINLIASRYCDAKYADKHQEDKSDLFEDNDDNKMVNALSSEITGNQDFIALCQYVNTNIVKLNLHTIKKVIKLTNNNSTYDKLLKLIKKNEDFIKDAINDAYEQDESGKERSLQYKQNIFVKQLRYIIDQVKTDNVWGSSEPNILEDDSSPESTPVSTLDSNSSNDDDLFSFEDSRTIESHSENNSDEGMSWLEDNEYHSTGALEDLKKLNNEVDRDSNCYSDDEFEFALKVGDVSMIEECRMTPEQKVKYDDWYEDNVVPF